MPGHSTSSHSRYYIVATTGVRHIIKKQKQLLFNNGIAGAHLFFEKY